MTSRSEIARRADAALDVGPHDVSFGEKIEYALWAAALPPRVRDVALALPPWGLYEMSRPKGQRVEIISYGETADGDVLINVHVGGHYNFVVIERNVFDVRPENLTRCYDFRPWPQIPASEDPPWER